MLDQGKICASIPKIENLEWIRKLKNMGIYASDIFEREASLVFEQNPQEIHLLLVADVAGTIFMDVDKPLPWKGVVVLKTKLGLSSLVKPFKLWFQYLPALFQVHIPRWLNITSENENCDTLHGFCETSKQGYATCAYVRIVNMSKIKVQLVSARSLIFWIITENT